MSEIGPGSSDPDGAGTAVAVHCCRRLCAGGCGATSAKAPLASVTGFTGGVSPDGKLPKRDLLRDDMLSPTPSRAKPAPHANS